MLVFVLNKHRKPLMPCKPARARHLLKEGKAKIKLHRPFTIQLLHGSSGYTQPLTLGMDPGYKTAAVSVVSEKKEILSAVVELRTDVSDKITERRMYRRNRRYRLRYRQPRFLNRKRDRVPAPSMEQKVHSHLRILKMVERILPIKSIVFESASFDPHRLKNPEVSGSGYQLGDQFGFENVKAFVLDRDNHQCLFNRGCARKLHVHHIVPRSKGGSNRPDNLITLCEKHHDQVHIENIALPIPKPQSLKSATFMNIVRSQLMKIRPDMIQTFGYLTKALRKALSLEKFHIHDAFVIAGGTTQARSVPQGWSFKRKNSRVLQINRKGYSPSIRRKRYAVQPHDLVSWKGQIFKAVGIQNYGAYLKFTDGIKTWVRNMKEIQIVFHQKTLVIT